MSLSIHTNTSDGVMIVALGGSADASLLAPLHAPLVEALADTSLVVLALDDLASVDADALRTLLVDLLEGARGGELRVAASDRGLRGALAAARVHHLVAVHESVADAVAQTGMVGR